MTSLLNIFLAITLLLFSRISFAQSDNFNYLDVNTEAFSVPVSMADGNFLNAYNLSLLDMSHRLTTVFNSGEMNKEYYLSDKIKATKVFYTKDNVRMLILQPVSENTRKHCILLTNGNGENYNWSQSNLSAIDFALRGYVVAFYENMGNVATRFDGQGNTNSYFTGKVINLCNGIGKSSAKDKFFSTMFVNFLLSNAARKFVVEHHQTYAVDTTRFFIVGGSLGGNASLFFTYANANNLTHPLFNCAKQALGYDYPINQNGIVATGVQGGGLPGPKEGLGEIINQQSKTPVIMLAGAIDWVVNPNKTTLLGPENWGALALKNIFDSYRIKSSIVVNVYGTHVFSTPAYADSWSSLKDIRNFDEPMTHSILDNYVKSNVLNLLMYQYEATQLHEGDKIIAAYFNKAANRTLPESSVAYVQPKCIQNTIFYQYSLGQMSIKDAANCLTFKNCDNKINRQLDKETTTCFDGTIVPYTKPITSKLFVPNNMNAPGKGLVKLINVLDVLNKLGGK
ncbi:MAG: hypothetical protein RJA25_1006 [Bacteroidota bacterium]|jgi:dienelactone hydrolase